MPKFQVEDLLLMRFLFSQYLNLAEMYHILRQLRSSQFSLFRLLL